MLDARIEDVKIVVTGGAISWESVPQRRGCFVEVVQMKHPSYQRNGMRWMDHSCVDSVTVLSYKYLNWWNFGNIARMKIFNGNSDRVAIGFDISSVESWL